MIDDESFIDRVSSNSRKRNFVTQFRSINVNINNEGRNGELFV